MAFSPPVVGRLVKKGLQKGKSRTPQDPPWGALVRPGPYLLRLTFQKNHGRTPSSVYGRFDTSRFDTN